VRGAVTEIGSGVIYKERLQVEGDRGTEQLLELWHVEQFLNVLLFLNSFVVKASM
jgi:hypothetical protein